MKIIKISYIINIIIVFLVIICSIFMLTGFKLMLDNTLLESTKIDMFKFFTAYSNILIAVVSLILLIFEYKLINKKINIIPNYIYILKYIEI